jgi:release factor glutamine methyltransferase
MEDSDRPALAAQRETKSVYEPAEDSALLARTTADLLGGDERVLDVGTGSGFVATELADTGATVVASDINPMACTRARDAGHAVVRGDLLDPFQAASFDVVTFNPPYLPTPSEREWDDWMEHALSGGADGRRLVDPFLAGVGRVLRPGGRAFMLVSSLTDIEAVQSEAAEQGFSAAIVAEESHPYERLVVLALEQPF